MFDAAKLKLYLVTDPYLCATFGLLNTVNAAVKGGITMVQLRDKEASTKDRIGVGKELQKIYHRYSGYVGGHHEDTPATLREKAPERLVEFAVKGMIPRNRLGRQIIKKLKIYAGPDHKHEAQDPSSIQL